MAYDVVKTIGGRQYRYRVQSERDAQTGKARNRWTYVGRVDGETTVAKARPPRANARLRLLEAAEALLATGDAAAVTVDAIAAHAGVAHGTFYRYFRDRSDVLRELALHMKTTRDIRNDQLLLDDVATVADARAGLRRWVTDKLRFARDHRAIFCAWQTLVASDPRLHAFRVERRMATERRLGEYLAALDEHGLGQVTDPAATAACLLALIDGIERVSLIERDRLDEPAITAAADIFDRAIFVMGLP